MACYTHPLVYHFLAFRFGSLVFPLFRWGQNYQTLNFLHTCKPIHKQIAFGLGLIYVCRFQLQIPELLLTVFRGVR